MKWVTDKAAHGQGYHKEELVCLCMAVLFLGGRTDTGVLPQLGTAVVSPSYTQKGFQQCCLPGWQEHS